MLSERLVALKILPVTSPYFRRAKQLVTGGLKSGAGHSGASAPTTEKRLSRPLDSRLHPSPSSPHRALASPSCEVIYTVRTGHSQVTNAENRSFSSHQFALFLSVHLLPCICSPSYPISCPRRERLACTGKLQHIRPWPLGSTHLVSDEIRSLTFTSID